MDAASAAIRSARAAGSASGGTLRLGCAQSLVSVLAPVIHDWHRRYPDVAIALRESTSVLQLHALIDADEADLVLMPGAVPERFTSTVVADEEVVVVAPADHALARSPAVRMRDLDGERLVHYAPENGLSSWLERAFSAAGIQPETVMRTAVTSAAPQLAAAGLGVAVAPISAISDGFAGAVRSFSPRWTRQLRAVTACEPDALVARCIAGLRSHGVPVPADVRAQLIADPTKR
jgi:DNA-binding transcriptional LysR family regulator